MKKTGLACLVALALAGCGDRHAREREAAGEAASAKAFASLAAGDIARALAAAELAVQYEPLNSRRRDQLMRLRLVAIGIAPDAIRVDDTTTWDVQAEVLLARDPDHTADYETARGYLVLAKDTAAAKAHFDAALVAYANHAPAHVGVATILTAQQKRDDAIAALEKAIAADPNLAIAHANLGRLQLEKNEDEKATASLEKATKLRPTDATAWQNLAVAYWRAKKQKESGEAIQKAATLEPKNAAIRLELANWLKETGQAELAFEHYGIAGQLGAEPQATFQRGLLLFQAKNYGEAAKSFDAAAVNKMPSALYESGRAYEAAGDANTAAARYQRFIEVRQNEQGEQERLQDARARLQPAANPQPAPPP